MPPPFDSWPSEPQFPAIHNLHPSLQSSAPQNKKPRHRHSPHQLAALNDLFDRNEHPPLEQRTALADRLGMYALFFLLFVTLLILGQGNKDRQRLVSK